MSDSFVTPWVVACQAPLSMGFPRQEYWSGLPFPSPGDLPDPVTEPSSPELAGRSFTTGHQGIPIYIWYHISNDYEDVLIIWNSVEIKEIFSLECCCYSAKKYTTAAKEEKIVNLWIFFTKISENIKIFWTF